MSRNHHGKDCPMRTGGDVCTCGDIDGLEAEVAELKCQLHQRTGDRGQRYEVRFTEKATGKPRVMGWTNEADGGALLESAKLWPIARDPFVEDRLQRGTWVSCMAGHVYPMTRGDEKCPYCEVRCTHDRLDEDGICRSCGKDCRGAH